MCAGVVIGSNHPPDGKTHHAGKFKRSSVRFSGLLPNPLCLLRIHPSANFRAGAISAGVTCCAMWSRYLVAVLPLSHAEAEISGKRLGLARISQCCRVLGSGYRLRMVFR